MTTITQHVPEDLIRAFAAGLLPHPFAVVVAAHVSMCDECRAVQEAAEMVGGAVLDHLHPVDLSADRRARMMAALDLPMKDSAPMRGDAIFPGPVRQVMGGLPPKWRSLGGGIRQQILSADTTGSLRLIYIPPGRAVPEHGHRGLEMTLVLQGSFSDSQGLFGRGDVEAMGADIDHQPVADAGQPCICLAATDAPVRFAALLPRLLQPLFRI